MVTKWGKELGRIGRLGLTYIYWSESRSVVSGSLQAHGLCSPWNTPGQNTGVDSHSLLQGLFPTKWLNPVSHIPSRFFTVWGHQGSLYIHIYMYIYTTMNKKQFDPWVWKILWRRAWQPTPAFLPGESPWTEEPGGLQSLESQRVGHN